MASGCGDRRDARSGGPWPALVALSGGYVVARFAGGGTAWDTWETWGWLGLAAVLLACGMALPAGGETRPRGSVGLRRAARLGAIAALGVAWYAAAPNRPAAPVAPAGAEPRIVRVRGIAASPPRPAVRPVDPLGAFAHLPAATSFPLRLAEVDGAACGGRLTVHLNGVIERFDTGDRVEATGLLVPPPAPANPGERDRRHAAQRSARLGTLFVSNRALIRISPERSAPLHTLRVAFRDAAERSLFRGLPAPVHPSRDAMLQALVTGRRSPPDPALDGLFRRTGVAHLLAISGLHLGVVLGMVMLVLRGRGARRRWHGLVLAAAVAAFLALVELRVPVTRASLMAFGAAAGMTLERRWRLDRVLAVVAIALLLWRPDDLFAAGFQLSFGVVLALITLAPRVHARWFGRLRRHERGAGHLFANAAAHAFTAAVVAWLVATPIAARHFGMVSLLAVPLTLTALPLVALVLATALVKLLAGVLLPTVGLLAGLPLAAVAELMLSIVTIADRLPGSAVLLTRPTLAWTGATLGWVALWASGHLSRRAALGGALLLLLVVLLPRGEGRAPTPLRLDMLDVGNGTCIVARSNGATLVYDAGSTSDVAVGSRTLVPALRAIGVRRIDRLVITHADLDHYAGVVDVATAMPVGQIMAGPRFLAARDQSVPVARLLDALAALSIPVTPIVAGDRLTIGAVDVTCLHPDALDTAQNDNDSSIVLRLDAAEGRVLLTGDLGSNGILALRGRHPDLRADVLELPHHGSDNAGVRALIDHVAPRLVLQSTGRARLDRDPWAARLRGRARFVTARDGAAWVEIHTGRALHAGRWRPRQVHPAIRAGLQSPVPATEGAP